jgi:hypothetical protein
MTDGGRLSFDAVADHGAAGDEAGNFSGFTTAVVSEDHFPPQKFLPRYSFKTSLFKTV